MWKEWYKRRCPESLETPEFKDAYAQDLHTEFSQQLLFAGIKQGKIIAGARIKVNPSHPIEAFLQVLCDKEADKEIVTKVVKAALDAAKKEKFRKLIFVDTKCDCLVKKVQELGFKLDGDGNVDLDA